MEERLNFEAPFDEPLKGNPQHQDSSISGVKSCISQNSGDLQNTSSR